MAESINRSSGWKQSHYSSVRCNWIISRYARAKKLTNSSMQGKERWDFYDYGDGEINLSILSCNRMIITQGHRIFENYDLLTCSKYLRAVTKGDSMAFISKLEDDHRQFRVKFASKVNKTGAEECSDCKNELKKFLHFQNFSEVSQSQDNTSLNNNQLTLTEDSSLSDLSKYFLDPSAFSLPYTYKHSPLPSDELEEIIWLCLNDEQFPGFVNQVGEMLKKLAEV